MVEVQCKFRAAFLQMKWGIWSEFMVFSMLRSTGIYLSIIPYHQGVPKFILQHDNDPKHTMKVIKNNIQRKEEQVNR